MSESDAEQANARSLPVPDTISLPAARVETLERENASLQAALQEARQDSDRLRGVLAGSGIGLWDLDLASRAVSLSPTCKAIYGLAAEAGYDREAFRRAVDPADLDRYVAAMRAAVHGEADLELSYRFRRLDGELRWVEVRGYAVHGPGGERAGLSGIAIDVTDRKRAEADLAAEERRYRAITDSIEQMIWSARSDGYHDYHNQRWYEFTGTAPGSTDGRGRNLVIHPADGDAAWTAWQQALATGEPYRAEYRLRHRSGAYRWVLARAQPVRDDSGAIARWYGTCTDIHDLKTASETISELEERYRLASRATSDAIWEWRAGTGSITWNESLEEVFGHAELNGVAGHWLECVHPQDRERVRGGLVAALAGDAARWAADYRFRRADGSYAAVSDRAFITRDEDGIAKRMTGAIQDHTERRRAETELRRLAETLEERVRGRTAELAASNDQLVAQIEERERVAGTLRQMQRLEAVGQLTGGVAHDFNNLLTVILGNVGFLQRGLAGLPNAEKMLRRLGNMESAADRGAKLTAQLLAFSRRQRLEPKPVDLNGTVGSLRDLLQSTMGGAVRIDAALSASLWPAFVDPTQIELVIFNLAINARDAMASGGILRVETGNAVLRGGARRPEEPEPGEYVVVAVVDSGAGMSDEVQAKAFEPFFTTKEVGKGTGLGLSQVLGFAKQSGGGVQLESRPGEGTTVKVFLPRAARGGNVVDLRERPGEPAGGPDERVGTVVLLVDDDDAVREVTAELLREARFTVVEAGSGDAGLEALDRAGRVDLLLVDFVMPGMNGVEVAREAQPPACRPCSSPATPISTRSDPSARSASSPSRSAGSGCSTPSPWRSGARRATARRCSGAAERRLP